MTLQLSSLNKITGKSRRLRFEEKDRRSSNKRGTARGPSIYVQIQKKSGQRWERNWNPAFTSRPQEKKEIRTLHHLGQSYMIPEWITCDTPMLDPSCRARPTLTRCANGALNPRDSLRVSKIRRRRRFEYSSGSELEANGVWRECSVPNKPRDQAGSAHNKRCLLSAWAFSSRPQGGS